MRLAVATAVTALLVVFADPTTAAPAPSATASKGVKKILPFHEDDYATALAEARAKKLPLFIEAWAPW
jgi:hypothetical protein